ncbi:unnamed protein product [Protopolystoma xenopodis]|uniref:Uncharacterized protein n=1 Tax=Protopolystoma xenopodis TaxID=117903 RepID=A0A448WLW1_9PLAT|nr:unnamed protein product [Protopolystoma xenopodis]
MARLAGCPPASELFDSNTSQFSAKRAGLIIEAAYVGDQKENLLLRHSGMHNDKKTGHQLAPLVIFPLYSALPKARQQTVLRFDNPVSQIEYLN